MSSEKFTTLPVPPIGISAQGNSPLTSLMNEAFKKIHPCSLLNEFCQKLGIPEPIYFSVNNPDGTITVTCTILKLSITISKVADKKTIAKGIFFYFYYFIGLAAMEAIEQMTVEGRNAAIMHELLSKKILVSGLEYQGPLPPTLKRKKPENTNPQNSGEIPKIDSGLIENMNKINIACQKLGFTFKINTAFLANNKHKIEIFIDHKKYGEGLDFNKKTVFLKI